jgi:hypothetical protein
MAPVAASAQIVVPDVKRWSEKESSWLYQHVLPECRTQRLCSATPDFSMSTERGLTSLDAILTVRNRQQFDGICLRVCQENTRTPPTGLLRPNCRDFMARKDTANQ